MIIKIVPPSLNLIEKVADNLREADRLEVQASCGLLPLSAINESIESSYESGVVTKDGDPQLVFGIVLYDDEGTSAIPWMLATDGIKDWQRTFLDLSCTFVRNWSNHFGSLFNYVDARNKTSLRWLEWMGFDRIGVVKQYGVEGRPFVCMERCVTH